MLNRFRMGRGHCAAALYKCWTASSDRCPYRPPKTTNHTHWPNLLVVLFY